MSTARVARSRRLSLSEVLGAHGIQTMPRTWAKEHKAIFLRQTRSTGYGPRATFLLLLARYLLQALSFAFLPLMAERESEAAGKMASRIYGSALISTAIAGGFLGHFVHPLFWLMILPTIFLVVAAVFESVRRLADMQKLAASTSWWNSERRTVNEGLEDLPLRLHERVMRVSAIPGVRVYEEILDDDPLIYAVRGWGPFKEISYLGGYATGVDRIDNF